MASQDKNVKLSNNFKQEKDKEQDKEQEKNKEQDKNQEQDKETVVLSQEYLYECVQKKEQGMLDAALILAQKKITNDNKEKVLKKIEQYLKSDFIKSEKFETDNIDFLYDKICKENPSLIKQSGLSIMINGDVPKKYALSLLYIYILKGNIENKNENIKSLQDDLSYFDEQIDIKDKEIDDIEKKLKDPKLTLRIIKLRNKCIQKNNKIKLLYGLVSFLTFTNLIGQKNVIYLFNYLMYILFLFSRYTFVVIKEMSLLLYENIWIDLILLFYFGIGFYIYKYKLLPIKSKKND